MLTRLSLENFKSWKDTGDIPMKPITGFFGANSSGKTSLLQALLMMKQTVDSPDRGIVLHFGDDKTPVDLGDFESVIHRHDTEQTLMLSLDWNSKYEIEIPDEFGHGPVTKGDGIGFDVKIREGDVTYGKLLIVDMMAYRMVGRQLGMWHLPMGMADRVFAKGFNIDPLRLPLYNRFPSKFHEFPHVGIEHLSVMEDFEYRRFTLDLQYGLESLLRDLLYLGPLRSSPRRIYTWSGAELPDMGATGEYVVNTVLSSREQRKGALNKPGADIAIAEWLKRLGLVHDFRVEPLVEGRRLFEVKVRKSPASPEVLLTDIGFGVSQILPVLALCFCAPEESTLILEQPDIHLHPSAQAGLADVLIEAMDRRGVQILFESHSEHLLRRIQRRIAEGSIKQDDIGLFFCSMEEDGSSSLSHLELDEYGNIANWPKDFFGDQFGEIAAMSEAALKRKAESD